MHIKRLYNMTKWYLPRNASQFNIQKSINIIYHTIKDQKKKKNCMIKDIIQLKNGQRIEVDISPKKIYKWPTNI